MQRIIQLVTVIAIASVTTVLIDFSRLQKKDASLPAENKSLPPVSTIIMPSQGRPFILPPNVVENETPSKPPITAKPVSSASPSPSTAYQQDSLDYSKPWTVAPNCPVSTRSCVPCTSGSDCRYEPGKTHGFRGWACQNNNPGNIRNASTNLATDFKNVMIIHNGGTAACGIRYDSRGGSYFVFRDYTTGYEALKAYVKGINNGEHEAYAGCGDCSITFFFSKYAPNDATYAPFVASYVGEPESQTIRYIVEHKLTPFVDAIKQHEGFITE